MRLLTSSNAMASSSPAGTAMITEGERDLDIKKAKDTHVSGHIRAARKPRRAYLLSNERLL